MKDQHFSCCVQRNDAWELPSKADVVEHGTGDAAQTGLHAQEEKQQDAAAERQDELAQASALLQDPAQVAPIDTKNFGKRFSEILLRTLGAIGGRGDPFLLT